MTRFSGIFTPITTPFRNDALDEVGLRNNVAHWMRTPLDGLVVLGSNGEAPQLEDSEADRAIAIVREGVPGTKVLLAGTGRESTKATIAATRRAASLGIDAALVRTPSFFKSQMTSDIFVRHYTEVADASPVPILLYNVTMFTGVNLAPDAVERLAAHPNIAGMKESGTDVAQTSECVNRTPDDFTVLAGAASTLFVSLCAGCSGAILAVAGVLPELCVALWQAVRENRMADARRLQRRILPVARSVGSVYGVAGLKAALDLLGLAGGPPRPPLRAAPPQVVALLKQQLEAVGRLRPASPVSAAS
ncbi:MAG: dihydrodipicolinate synthase family protein [Vicinamibacterales bacterium]